MRCWRSCLRLRTPPGSSPTSKNALKVTDNSHSVSKLQAHNCCNSQITRSSCKHQRLALLYLLLKPKAVLHYTVAGLGTQRTRPEAQRLHRVALGSLNAATTCKVRTIAFAQACIWLKHLQGRPPPAHLHHTHDSLQTAKTKPLCGDAGIDKLQFQPNGDISGMVSAEGELVPLKTRIKPSTVGGAVEKWLIQVLPCCSLWQASLHIVQGVRVLR